MNRTQEQETTIRMAKTLALQGYNALVQLEANKGVTGAGLIDALDSVATRLNDACMLLENVEVES